MEEHVVVKKVADLGSNFPVGVKQNDQLDKSFKLSELSTDIEKEFGRFRKENKNLPEAKEVTKLLSLLFTQIGSDTHTSILNRADFDGFDPIIEEAKDLFKISSMPVADVYYAYLYARLQEMGNDYEVTFGCQGCGHIEDIVIDLTTMDVMCIEDINKLKVEVPLTFGFKSASDRVIKKVNVNPLLWQYLESNEFAQCEGDDILLKLYFIEKCTTFDDVIDKKKNTFSLTKNQINQLKKIDREKIAKAISVLNLGPSFIVEGKCPKCGTEFMYSVDWRYNGFFAVSSL